MNNVNSHMRLGILLRVNPIQNYLFTFNIPLKESFNKK